jgi:hypothetical protein
MGELRIKKTEAMRKCVHNLDGGHDFGLVQSKQETKIFEYKNKH